MMSAEAVGAERARRWVRAEHVVLVLVLSALVVTHRHEVIWARFLAAFALIDLVGYLPGAIAFRRAHGGPIAAGYHHLYNLAHSYVVAAAGIECWAQAAGGFEWAMLAVPIHLSGDRGILGNFFRPVSLPFERSTPGSRGRRDPAFTSEEPR
jgi:hypothetical protein